MRIAIALVLAGCAGAADIITPSDVNMMATLADGRVMLAGGNTSPALKTVLAFDPDTGAWSPLDSLATGRARGTLTTLTDGTVLAVAGFDGLGGSVASAERYDPATGHWSAAGALPIAVQQQTATVIADGSVIVIGGFDGSVSVSQVRRYDPANNTWTARAAMINPRHNHVAVLLPDGRIFCVGGYTNGVPPGGEVATADIYDPATDSWSNAAPMSRARYDLLAALLPDGTVAAFGGSPSTSPPTMEIYHPSTNAWSAPTAMPHDHAAVNALTLFDGKVLLIAGGSTGDLYDPTTSTWSTPTCISLSKVRGLNPASLAGDGRAVIACGVGPGGLLGDAEVFGQHIDFATIPAHTTADAPFALTASSSAGLPMTFRVLSGPATVSGSTLTLTGAGTVVVRAEQAGDTTWFPAARVRSFTVTAAPGTTTGSTTGGSTGSPTPGATYGAKPTNGTKNFFCGLGSGSLGLVALALGLIRLRRRS